MTTPALFGLVLAGGASTRMRTDKAALQYHGQPQLRWAFELVSKFCAASFVSVRPDQRDDAARAGHPQIVDRQPGIGPIAGISAALLEQPKAGWLVLACDLPFLTERTLQHLIAHRDPQKIATAYRSAHDGLPEPLCAIWEPAAREPVLAYIASGKQCPRKFLINSDTALLDLPEHQALDNVNTVKSLGWRQRRCARKRRPRKPCACSTTRSCASRPGAARRRSIRAPAQLPSCTRSCGSVIRSN
jgi:molybdopterin-guanine dinucleotide biosynthesis protein A